jgi:hypothetical protein
VREQAIEQLERFSRDVKPHLVSTTQPVGASA